MARVKFGKVTRARRKRWIKRAKGYYGTKKSSYKKAHEQVVRSMAYAYIGRKQKKRDFRQLWITRINAAVRPFGLSYSRFMNGLKKANIDVNRKMLSELAISNPNEFEKIVHLAQTSLGQPTTKSTAKPVELASAKKVEKTEQPKIEKVEKVEKPKTEQPKIETVEKTEVDSHDYLAEMEAKYAAELKAHEEAEKLEREAHEKALALATEAAEKEKLIKAREAAKAQKAQMSTEERAKLDGSDSIKEARSELQKHANKMRSLVSDDHKTIKDANLRDMTKKELIKYMRQVANVVKK
ncbi:50S ribosomal protein L20 [Williamsoniiplasma luminosum]|uniref:Large ribosomal subunit protein bL20 n=1 Tax=Williamsoniiplasma luminosum TaxID=214888 RepID=A0A2K8NUQ9_9MOLU|nr:50S ribosomal protein L20 [Williamsoniiplasma luminosum]